MGKTGLRYYIYFVVIVVLVLGWLYFYLPERLQQEEEDRLQTQLPAQAQLIADSMAATSAAPEHLEQWITGWEASTGAQANILVFAYDPEGKHTVISGTEDLLYHPEVEQALATGRGFDIDQKMTTAQAAVSTLTASGDTWVVHVSLPFVSSAPRLRVAVLIAALTLIAAGAVVSYHLGKETRGRLQRLTETSRRLAAGDLRARLIPRGRDDFTTMCQTFNAMADEFESRVTTMTRQRDEQAAVLEYMADGVLILDGSGRVQLVNHAATELLQMERASIVGRSFAQVVRDHHLVELWHRSQQYGQEEIAGLEISHLGLYVRAIVTPLAVGESPRCMILIQDLTRTRQLETVRRDFVSNISHELRTPLASIKAVVDTLREGALSDLFAAQHFLDRLDTEVEDITQIVQELLELSRVESGRVSLRREPTSVDTLVVTPVDRLRPQAERAQLAMEINIAEDLPLVMADTDRIRQVITNLVHNAIKFTPPKGTVTVSAEAVNDRVQIAVSDTGVGIPIEDVPRIFERFYKADQARSGGGTGLGLAIARHVVEAHRGEIWVERIEGQGATFYFTLPVAKPRA